jgi:F0F1-type ATP synthase membrane subunit b/b'
MAASMNLTPNVWVMLVQTILFLFNAYIIQTFIVRPYMALRNKRLGLTSGAEEEATLLNEQNSAKLSELEAQIDEVKKECAEKSAGAIDTVKKESQLSFEKERESYVQTIQASRKELEQSLASEKGGLDQIASSVTKELSALIGVEPLGPSSGSMQH